MEFNLYSNSTVEHGGTSYSLVHTPGEKFLRVRGNTHGFQDERFRQDGASLYPLTLPNAAQLRERLNWLKPQPFGVKTSFGFGDRLGLGTPGHIQSLRGAPLAPIFAQQSVRENARTGRSPQQVMDDAMWGVFQCGWRGAWGADADHLKTTNDIAPFVAAGYTFFTVDPGEYVDNASDTDSFDELEKKLDAMPWDAWDDSIEMLRARYLSQPFALGESQIQLTEENLWRAAAKYGRAVQHATAMFQEIARQKKGDAFDFEVSVDETETPTSPEEHFYIANELKRARVRVTSLAPRFVGRFEKGVDYLGDLEALAKNLEQHARIAKHFQYKLSLHSGSDKFSVYPLFALSTQGLAHVKTAGTSYLEALRTLAHVEPALFRKILTLAHERYPIDRATYHVSAELERVRTVEKLRDNELAQLLDEFDARQILHVTFGSALHTFGDEIYASLRAHETEYGDALRTHFAKHLAPFVQTL